MDVRWSWVGLGVGTSGVDFHVAGNWSPIGVPDTGTRVLVDSANPMTITGEVTLLDLTIGGGVSPSTATVDAALTVIENITVWTNGTLVLNRPSVVSNAVYVLAGGTLEHDGLMHANAPEGSVFLLR